MSYRFPRKLSAKIELAKEKIDYLIALLTAIFDQSMKEKAQSNIINNISYILATGKPIQRLISELLISSNQRKE